MITIHTLVDNAVQRSSALWGEHGVSFGIDSSDGRILFDTGQSGSVLVHNAALMDIHLDQFDALAISHAHYDHTGGLRKFLTYAKPGLPLYANPGLFQERFSIRGGKPESIGLRLTQDQLSERLDLRLQAKPTEILPGVWTTGEITGRLEFEGSSPNHKIQVNGRWLPDPYLDDLSLIVDAKDGLIVICGCCHAGLLNTLMHIHNNFHKKFHAIIGGMHLASTSLENLKHTVDIIKFYSREGVISLYPNHCTGENAYIVLAQAFGEQVRPCPAGTRLGFD